MTAIEDEWVWGWDDTPGIVSIWATLDGRATVWRRVAGGAQLVRERERFRPWALVDSLGSARIEFLDAAGTVTRTLP